MLKVGTIVVTIGGAFAILAYFNGAMTRAVYPDNSKFLTSAEIEKIDVIVAETKQKGDFVDRKTIEKNYLKQNKVDDRAIPYFARHNLPSFLGGIFLAGVLAAGMSTFAAILILIAGSILKDLVVRMRKKEIPDKDQIKIGRYLNVGITVISVFIAMFKFKMILDLTVFSWSVIAGAFFVPLVFGLYFRWITRAAVIISMVSGSVSALLWRILRDFVKAGDLPNLSAWMYDFIGVSHEFIVGIIISFAAVCIFSIFTKRFEKSHLDKIFIAKQQS